MAEEQLVFPSLLADGDSEIVAHVQRLQQDHGWLEEDWLEIGPQLRPSPKATTGTTSTSCARACRSSPSSTVTTSHSRSR